MRTGTKIALATVLAAALLSQTGCVFRRVRIAEAPAANQQETSESVELDGATEGEVVLMMGAGNLTVEGGAETTTLLEGDFTYAPVSLAPVFEPASLGERQQVIIRNKREDSLGDFWPFGKARFRNEWDIRLTEAVPVEQLSITVGAGNADIDLTEVDVRSMSVNMGAGDATVDLSGERTKDVTAFVQAGAGNLTIRVPKSVGVRVKGHQDGVGEWDASGFTTDGNYLINEAYETADVRIELNVQRGVGEVTLELVD